MRQLSLFEADSSGSPNAGAPAFGVEFDTKHDRAVEQTQTVRAVRVPSQRRTGRACAAVLNPELHRR